MPVHQASHAAAPGLIQDVSWIRLGEASVAIKSEFASSAAVRPKIRTRQGLTRGTAEATNPLPSERRSSAGFTVVAPALTSDIPAQSSTSDSATAKKPAGVSTSSGSALRDGRPPRPVHKALSRVSGY